MRARRLLQLNGAAVIVIPTTSLALFETAFCFMAGSSEKRVGLNFLGDFT